METTQTVSNIRTKNPHALAWGVCQNRNMMRLMIRTTMILLILVFLVGWFGSWSRLMKTGNEAYWNKDYDVAVQVFQDAAINQPNNHIAHYNLAAALYKKGKYQEAATTFRKSLLKGNIPNEADVYYNIGNAQFQMQDFTGAIDSYKHSLQIQPKDVDAKYNLTLALQLLKQQQENLIGQQDKSDSHNNKTQSEPNNMSKSDAQKLLERLTQNENKHRQNILKQQLNSSYRRDKDW